MHHLAFLGDSVFGLKELKAVKPFPVLDAALNKTMFQVTGYNGDAGDSLSLCNQQTFKVRPSVSNGIRSASSDCTATHKSGTSAHGGRTIIRSICNKF